MENSAGKNFKKDIGNKIVESDPAIGGEKLDLDDFRSLLQLVEKNSENLDSIKPIIKIHIEQLIKKSKLGDKYNIVFLILDDSESINRFMLDQIYAAVSDFNGDKDILLIIESSGGEVEPAYLISKACKRYSKDFCVVIPRRAKSAATLIALGADRIHMGDISEIGPIDLQIGKKPAVSLENAVISFAEIVEQHPRSADMLARLLSQTLDLKALGYYKRVADSTIDYAERLLDGKTFPGGMTARIIANKLVKEYKDHGFVIDEEEATSILGEIVLVNSPEYLLGNQIYKFLNFLNLACWVATHENYKINLMGSLEGGFLSISRAENNLI